ncbi:unnamed protein product [Ambrosiozyma monospora]|uniref:Unnamed protein product n=1 Tax=Ambrosiozyma monospora TaxID=43982 RepID=A0A9W6YZW4_AMBMO|nr:unnamed protein product [Ambrosiozyma monospora]
MTGETRSSSPPQSTTIQNLPETSSSLLSLSNNSSQKLPSLDSILTKIQRDQKLPLPAPSSSILPNPQQLPSLRYSYSSDPFLNKLPPSFQKGSLPSISSLAYPASGDISSSSSFSSRSSSIDSFPQGSSSNLSLPLASTSLYQTHHNHHHHHHHHRHNRSHSYESLDSTIQQQQQHQQVHQQVHQLFQNQQQQLEKQSQIQVKVNSPKQTVAVPRKYRCKTCGKSFTTSGHLARHNRIHTGVKNHICPFEGCGARFSRQDNCMQHYKTHLHKKGRKRAKAVVVDNEVREIKKPKSSSPSPSP